MLSGRGPGSDPNTLRIVGLAPPVFRAGGAVVYQQGLDRPKGLI
jgi:hypothetical protein